MTQSEYHPLVSVLLPIRNESGCIEDCLGAILAQDYDPDRMEILIADGMSTDTTRLRIDAFSTSHPQAKIRILDNPGKIVPTGLNIALQHARGEVIIRVDGHTIIATDYVRQCVEVLRTSGADNVGGRMDAIGINRFGSAVALATSTPFGIGGGRFHFSEKEEWVDTVYMGAWPRRVFDKIGLFDEELVRDQDDEFNYRLREGGGKILLSPKIRSEYTVRDIPRSLWWQYYQYGFWKVRVLQKHPLQMSVRQYVPFVFVLLVFFSSVLVMSPALRLWSLFVPLLYAVTNLAASTTTVTKKGWEHLPFLPLVYAILHVSYGLGFLRGLLKFWNRWNDKIGKVPNFYNETSG